MNNN